MLPFATMRPGLVLAACIAIATAACTGMSPAAVPPPADADAQGLVVSPASLSMAPGGFASIDVSESGFKGTFTAHSSNTGVATVAPNGAAEFTVSAIDTGTTSVMISDGAGNSKAITVSVQTTIIGGQ
jgi:hypothetical protein